MADCPHGPVELVVARDWQELDRCKDAVKESSPYLAVCEDIMLVAESLYLVPVGVIA
jgi:hypothetical protein